MATANSTSAISGSVVVYTCMSGYEVPGGSTRQNIKCISGTWGAETSLQACKSMWLNIVILINMDVELSDDHFCNCKLLHSLATFFG